MILLPVGPEQPSRRRPWATYGLIGLCAFLHIVSLAVGFQPFLQAVGFLPARPAPLSWPAHLVSHAGFMHLCGNMFFLWVFGPNVEAALGFRVYVLAYFGLGIVSSVAHAWTTPTPQIPLVGASGAISALLGVHAWLFAKARLRVFYLFWWGVDSRSGVKPIPMLVCAAFWVAEQVFWLTADRALDMKLSVAFSAHLGGFVAGLCAGAAWAWIFPDWRARADLGPAPADAARVRALISAAEENMKNGHTEAASRAVTEALKIDPRCPLPAGVAYLRARR